MKQLVSIILALIMLLALAACGTNNDPAEPAEAPKASEALNAAEAPAPTGEPSPEALRLALLPDWPTESTDAEWVDYESVTPDMMRAYTDACETQGFTLIENDEGKWAKILFREDAWIEISDNTDPYACCSIRVTVSRHEGGMGAEEALAAVNEAVKANFRVWAYSFEPSESAAALIEITPEGFFEATGMQLFRAVFNDPPVAGAADPVFSTVPFIAAGGRAMALLGIDSAAAADIDDDGDTEAIVLSAGPTSGINSLIFEAFGLGSDGLESEALAGYALDHGRSSLAVHEGKPFLVWEKLKAVPGSETETAYAEPVEFALSVEYGEILIDDPDNVLNREIMAHFDW